MDATPCHRQVGHARNSKKEARGGQLIRCLCRRWEHIHKGKTPTETHQSSAIPPTLKNSTSNKSEERCQSKEKCKWNENPATDDKCRETHKEIEGEGRHHREEEDAQEIATEPQLVQISRYGDRRPPNNGPHLRIRRWGNHW